MLKLERLKLPVDGVSPQSGGNPSVRTADPTRSDSPNWFANLEQALLRRQAARLLRVGEGEILSCRLLRRSLDAREEPVWVCSAAVEVRDEAAVLRRIRDRRVGRMEPDTPYPFPVGGDNILTGKPPIEPDGNSQPGLADRKPVTRLRPVVVGAGPAGLFAALTLAAAGAPPVLLERGRPVEQRQADVERFWSTGELDPESNVQFGEGGAGTFSDGKLNTGTRDPRHRFILEQLVSCGAPETICTDAKPHVGTDRLYRVLQVLRRRLLDLGTDIRYETRLADLRLRDGCVDGVTIAGPSGTETLPCRYLLLCPGHSARDTFALLRRRGIPLEPKPFAVGVRIEHLQADIDAAQYREYAGRPGLPAASYKLSCHLPTGRGVFSFCVCPGGQVVSAASEWDRAVTNGMSRYARDGRNINGGLLVGVTPEDFSSGAGTSGQTRLTGPAGPPLFPKRDRQSEQNVWTQLDRADWQGKHPDSSFAEGPLSGVAFQRRLEAAAYALGGGGYLAPAQRVEDFLLGRPSTGPGRVQPTIRPGVTWTDLALCLPPFVTDSLRAALPILGRKLRGYDHPDAILTAVESRSSSPVRIVRDETGQSAVRGLYPCGEGAGYAGGILSAAADGMRCAERVLGEIL